MPVCRAVVLILALSAFLFDVVTPLTPTPIAVVHGKAISHPSIAAVCVADSVLLVRVSPFVEEILAAAGGQPADLLDLNCSRRC